MIFETDRLYITPLDNEKDILNFYSVIYQNINNFKYLNFNNTLSLNNLKLKLLLYKKYYTVGLGIYAVKLKTTNEIIGEASFFNSFNNLQMPEIGYIISENFWHLGYGLELVTGMVNYLKNNNSESIIARINKENIHSFKICDKLGFNLSQEDILETGVIRQTFTYKI